MDEILRALFRGEVEAVLPPYSAKSRQNQAFARVEELAEKMKKAIPEQYHFVLDGYERAVMELMDAAWPQEKG